MTITAAYSRMGILGLAIILFLLCMPHGAHAQATSAATDMSATIRAAIAKDPRSANLTPAQIDSMVAALSAKAQSLGVTPQQIAYEPGTTGIPVPSSASAQAPTNADQCSQSSWCSFGRYVAGGIRRNPVFSAFWVLSLTFLILVWFMRKNLHLLYAPSARIEKPAIGGGV